MYYVGRWIEEGHEGHQDPMDPFTIGHLAGKTNVVREVKQRATVYREAEMPWSQARHLLNKEGLSFGVG